ncbi:MAG: hypothetical protein KDA58_03470 [Planctomycetaceae bacterium]|nr:hypothetical protein [Planctomycetaceae bacterium]
MSFPVIMLFLVLVSASCVLAAWLVLRARHMDRWLPAFVFPTETVHAWSPDEPLDVFIAICDHYEPETGGASPETGKLRVDRWIREYPELFGDLADVDGRPPQYTFFYPQDMYRPEFLDELKKLCDQGYGDVDVHLHHDHDNAERLQEKLDRFRQTLFHQHGLLRRDPVSNEIVYGFIHGNWALCNSRHDGRYCGVDQELSVLLATGCYADFTFPSAPSSTQPRLINSIYYAQDIPGQRRSHEVGVRARVGWQPPADHLLMVQGALALDWANRKWGLIPRTENSDLHEGRPASLQRLQTWINAGVTVSGQPNWRFVKLHTHGCKPGNIDTLLGPGMQAFHRDLAALHQEHPRFRYHYVTAWEMAQLVHQAEQGASTPQLPLPTQSNSVRSTMPVS